MPDLYLKKVKLRKFGQQLTLEELNHLSNFSGTSDDSVVKSWGKRLQT